MGTLYCTEKAFASKMMLKR